MTKSRDIRPRRRSWLRRAVISIVSGILLATAVYAIIVNYHSVPSHCSSNPEIWIGYHPDLHEGQRTAISEIAKELRRCPRADVYHVYRYIDILGPVDNLSRVGTTYFRKNGRLQDYDIGDGGAYEDWRNVTTRAVEGVAAHGGTFNDLSRYGAYRFVL